MRYFILFGFLFSLSLTAANYQLPLNGRVEFLAIGNPTAVQIKGTTEETPDALSGTFEVKGLAVTGTAKLDMNTIDTGVGLRNRHMKEKYLETEKHRYATFALKKLNLPQAFVDGDFVSKAENFAGELTLHGVTRPLTGLVDMRREGSKLEFLFSFDLKVKDYQIASPSFMSITMADEVKVKALLTPTLKPQG